MEGIFHAMVSHKLSGMTQRVGFVIALLIAAWAVTACGDSSTTTIGHDDTAASVQATSSTYDPSLSPMERHVLELRAKLGLPNDDASLEIANREWRARPSDAPDRIFDPQIPLSDVEWDQFLVWNELFSQLEELQTLIAPHRDVVLGAHVAGEIVEPTVIVNVTADASAILIAEIKRVVPAGAAMEVRIVDHGADEHESLFESLSNDFTSFESGDSGGVFTDLANAGFTPVYLGWNPSDPVINIAISIDGGTVQDLPINRLRRIFTTAVPEFSEEDINFELGSKPEPS